MIITDAQIEMTPLEAIETAEKLIAAARHVLKHNERDKTDAGYDYHTLVGMNGYAENAGIRSLLFRIGKL